MLKVFKYPFDAADSVELMLPAGAKILHCDYQEDTGFCAWCLVAPAAPRVLRRFRMAGTGHLITEDVGRFINTAMLPSGLVFHFFEL